MWANSSSNNIDQDPQPSDGWELIESGYEPKMFVGEQVPNKVDIVGRSLSESESDCEVTMMTLIVTLTQRAKLMMINCSD